ncbi:MAG: glycosyltransferase family 1 protein [Nanoarchaeota archaeon]
MLSIVANTGREVSGIQNYSDFLIKELDKRKIKHSLINPSEENKLLKKVISLLGFNSEKILSDFPIFLKIPKIGTTHFTSQQQAIALLFSKQTKSIVTVHDIIPLATNMYASFFEKILYYLSYKGLKKADCIIADSQSTKNDLIHYLKIESKKITIVPLGVNLEIYKTSKANREKNTVLYVGSEMPRKNLKILFEAIAIVKKKIPDIKLIKVGVSQWKNAREELILLASKLGISNNVVFKDHSDNLAEEYNKCTIFVFPSLYEGFGLPLLEAMACGCAIVCSDRTSLPEIAGDTVKYFEPEDKNELAVEIYALLKNELLRKELSLKAHKRAQEFSWAKTAERTIRVY